MFVGGACRADSASRTRRGCGAKCSIRGSRGGGNSASFCGTSSTNTGSSSSSSNSTRSSRSNNSSRSTSKVGRTVRSNSNSFSNRNSTSRGGSSSSSFPAPCPWCSCFRFCPSSWYRPSRRFRLGQGTAQPTERRLPITRFTARGSGGRGGRRDFLRLPCQHRRYCHHRHRR